METVSEVPKKTASRIMHWTIVFIAMLSLMVSNGMVFTGITAFDSAILADFPEWSRGELKLRELITLIGIGILAPLFGILIDKVGVRALMIVGCLILIPSYFAYGHVENLNHIYILHTFLSIVMVCCGLNVGVILVSNWFVKHRGTAIGIAILGTSLGGAALAPLFGYWLSIGLSWREGFQYASVIPFILLAITIILVRSKPSVIGLKPYGTEGYSTQHQEDLSNHGLEYKDAIRTRSFWAITFIAMCTFYTLMGLQANLVLHLQDLGFDIQSASVGLTMLFIPALVGKFLFGLFADRYEGNRLLYANIIMLLIGLLALITSSSATVMYSIVLIGFAWGGFYTLLQLNAINNFGLKASGKILGTITILDALGGGLGIYLTGVIFDVYGSYQYAFIIFGVLCTIALILISQVKKHV
ncbi:Sugar phosphate permease [Colwellia chukchiensis]|uniref:Sugar phosphate permease n=1 Tax=Colwellia chukchiensis TaxID=641665 RepID=A0A1H7NL32_9GAMM|nr:MFS transporter [Colwellia chukchiensis]SEL24029.1 Sugar phosphate permease [Colwellia chukchiensis]